ncbi:MULTISPECIES: histidinol dehydrogenase [unclassified Sphingobium]|uniref:histidinol dehydrogenase n=1 Tax=unclassified Sphingobium TaxID=2611147 RepID=UPI000D1561E5|nr:MULTISPECIES: histidinol dehydrogenase [unclassified Sphingobium]MBG6117954.1 histidinol dehydrogenase [Sphingobium sp. JAI105]PSO12227.1 histidinol dehydrogenase [Sphingobium sp. AEW4]TWD08597.1 histidinol dehydrogenase [Sphingobium sp. AEW010]TWD25771.1 histidinol dehydrogenase [Sphingobium sp. AEW013]TWD28393.1 histidinol dehydrogenase [Sphingobium sp. AEW001]
MTQRLTTTAPDFAAAFTDLVDARREADEDVSRDVTAILKAVRANGDAALADYTQRFDHHDLNVTGWAVTAAETRAALDTLSSPLRGALELAAARITAYHEKQRPVDSDGVDSAGVRLGARWSAVDAAGLYVPGGRAAYPSSLLMNVIPAKVAGVQRIAMVTPTPNGEINPLVLAAAQIAGIEEIWRVGGAQAIAALAYGTDRIAPVDVITGPGNAWVAEAKRQLYGVVGIDMVAGPSEIVVVADGRNNPDWIAADLLSQSEHDPTSQSILFTDDAAFADAVDRAVDAQLGQLATEKVARASWAANGAIIIVRDFEEAMPLVNRLAAEHLELAVDDPDALFAKVRHAGSVFLGRMTPEAVGDYVAGPNHVLPTGRRARFSSGLSVLDFMKRTSFLSLDDAAIRAIGPAAVALAEAEGLPAHAASVSLRLT